MKEPTISIMKGMKLPGDMIDIFSSEFDSAYRFLFNLKINSHQSNEIRTNIEEFETSAFLIAKRVNSHKMPSPTYSLIFPALCHLIETASKSSESSGPEKLSVEIEAPLIRPVFKYFSMSNLEKLFTMQSQIMLNGWNINQLHVFCVSQKTSANCIRDIYESSVGFISLLLSPLNTEDEMRIQNAMEIIISIFRIVLKQVDGVNKPSEECLEILKNNSGKLFADLMDIFIPSARTADIVGATQLSKKKFSEIWDNYDSKILSCASPGG
jgi:hypothetical protein